MTLPQVMNKTERNFYEWLLTQDYAKENITAQPRTTPDFVSDEETWEVKKLYGPKIILHSDYQINYIEQGTQNDYFAIMPEDPEADTQPIFLIPCPEMPIESGKKTWIELEEYCVRDSVPESIAFKPVGVAKQFRDENQVRIPDIDDDIHHRMDILTSRNRLNIADGYERVLECVIDENGRVRDDGVDRLKNELEAEETSAFD